MKATISLLIFFSLLSGAMIANGKWNHFNQLPWSIPKGDVRILHTDDKKNPPLDTEDVDKNEEYHHILHEPFKPREYIRIKKSRE